MKKNIKDKLLEHILTVVILAAIAVYAIFFYGKDGKLPLPNEGEFAAYFLDVGQADATIFIFPDGKTMLYDAGNEEDGQTVRAALKTLGIDKLDILMISHPHLDHFGGAKVIVDNFEVDKMYLPDAYSESAQFEALMNAVSEHNIEAELVGAGDVLAQGAYSITVLSPEDRGYDEENSYSAAICLKFGKTSFLVMGDANEENEEEIIERFGEDISCDVLRVGHHGSKTSTCDYFLEYALPSYAVISVGDKNSMNLPSRAALSRLSEIGAKVYRTDKDGTVSCFSDGEDVKIITEK